jgi:hypothetical protein
MGRATPTIRPSAKARADRAGSKRRIDSSSRDQLNRSPPAVWRPASFAKPQTAVDIVLRDDCRMVIRDEEMRREP